MSLKIIVFSKPDCTPCRLTKQYFEAAGIQFNTDSAEENAGALRSLGLCAAPVILIEDTTGNMGYWSGFRPDLIKMVTAGIVAGNTTNEANKPTLAKLLRNSKPQL